MADLTNVQQVVQDIYDIKIQGATNIAKSAFQILIDELKRQTFPTDASVLEFLFPAMEMLQNARPTEPMMFNGMAYIKGMVADQTSNTTTIKDIALQAAQQYLDMISSTATLAIEHGSHLLEYGNSVLTHCHSSSAIKTIIANRRDGKEIFVYNTETRPLYQGRKTSMDFLKAGMKVTMIVDSSAGFILDKNDPFGIDIDAVIIGCDAIKLNGDIINKVGSYSICRSAYEEKIPVYIAGNLLKVDAKDSIQIETRNQKEVREDAPEGLEIINFAFDQVPAKYITGIVTEFGIIKPEAVKTLVNKKYPWMK